jgi:hypothetical protein
MLILFEVGRSVAIRQMKKDPEGAHSGIASVETAVFGLLGLLVGFTFFGAAGRFDHRRDLIVDETNKIGTAYLRLDLLPVEAQAAARETFRRYLDARIDFYRKLMDPRVASEEAQKTSDLQKKIWQEAAAASRSPGAHPDAGKLLLPALNEMIDITTSRTLAMQMHPPAIVFVMLFGMSLTGALLAGYAMAKAKQRNWLHAAAFALVMAVVVYVILDLEYPRLGLIRVDAFDQALVDLRNSMK